MKKMSGLGRGLDALIPESYTRLVEDEREKKEKGEKQERASVAVDEKANAEEKAARLKDQMRLVIGGGTQAMGRVQPGLRMVPVSQIASNPDQPRQKAEEAEIDSLASSLRESGLLQPIVVKQVTDNSFEVVCGERRVLAARKVGWKEIPAIIKEVADENLLELALVENIQREDLNAIEEAEAYQKLVETRKITAEEVGKKVGRDRTTVANALRLLRLPDEVRDYIRSGRITGGHARALLGLPSPEHQRSLADRIVSEQLSVRQVEEIVLRTVPRKRRAKRTRRLDAEIVDLEHRMSERLGARVRVFTKKNNKGRIEIQYSSLDDLDRIMGIIGVEKG